MRPLRITISGLRSYRTEQTIDLTGAGLFAIVGDTGSGKSSILEAIVYALFAGVTWEGGTPGELIADGHQTMTVELVFEVDGRAWTITRSMSRRGYPAPIHRLVSADGVDRVDGLGPVRERVERLLGGMTKEAFCSAVVLPQGRFETLLHATPAERTKILRAIFRLDELDAVRTLARTEADGLRPQLNTLKVERAALLPDPAGEASAAEADQLAASAREEAVRGAVGADRVCETETSELRRRQATLANLERELAEGTLALDPDMLADLSAREVSLRGDLQGAEAALRQAIAADRLAAAAVDDARASGRDAATLAASAATLSGAQERLPTLRARLDETRSTQAGLDDRTVALDKEEAEFAGLAIDETTATAQAVALENEAEGARERFRAAKQALATLREALEQRPAAETQLSAVKQALTTATAAQRLAATDLARAQSAVDAAEQAYREASSHAAAAAASIGHAPGDACPVCDRPLPAEWEPVHDADVASAQTALEEARAALEAARTADARAVQVLTRDQARLETAETMLAAAEKAISTARAEASKHVADPDLPDTEALAPLIEAGASIATAAKEARALAASIGTAVTEARTRIKQGRASIQRERATAEATARGIADDISAIDMQLRSLGDPVPAGARSAAASNDALIEAARIIGKARKDAEERERAAHAAGISLRDAQAAREAVLKALREEVDGPRAAHLAALVPLRTSVARIHETLELPPLGLPPSAPAEGGAAWAGSLGAAATGAAKALASEGVRVRERLRVVEEERASLLAGIGVTTARELDEALGEAIRATTRAGDRLERARRELPLAQDLDRRITVTEDRVTVLDELIRLLGDGGFPGHVIEVRQRSLLATASGILVRMSGGRYGFSDSFQVVDRGTGQARSPRTLSGGETFEASLALALALIEMAGRSGGRLSAVFLDEGFGTLDANALAEALAELERRAASGRVIGVISHLRAVAEQIERVLHVTRDSSGSHARWVDATEAEHLALADDAEHLAGLTV